MSAPETKLDTRFSDADADRTRRLWGAQTRSSPVNRANSTTRTEFAHPTGCNAKNRHQRQGSHIG